MEETGGTSRFSAQMSVRRRARFILLALGLAATLTLISVSSALATQTRPNFSESVPISGLLAPTDIAFAPDGRVFISEKSGLIKEYDSLSDPTPTVVADLRTEVHNFWDRGLLSLTLDPQFPERPYLYVLYTYDAAIGGTAPRWGAPGATSDGCPSPPGANADGCVVSGRVSRLQISGNVAVGNEKVLIEDWCQQFPSHSIGTVTFGPDGALYVSGGDGASFTITDYGQYGSPTKNPCGDPPAGLGGDQTPPSAEGGALRSQDIRTTADPTSLDGSVLRVDPNTGAGLPDNPLASSSDPNARRIIATGLRNPFRIAPRPGTSEIWAGEVGWGDWEEINRINDPTDGLVEDFGWPCYEGNGKQGAYQGLGLTICKGLYASPSASTAPFFTYNHADPVQSGDNCGTGGSSVSGLAFYESGDYPAVYQGALFFADYSRRCVWVMFPSNGTPDPSTRQLFARDVDPVDLETGPGGDLFLVDFTGTIRRYSYSATNNPPTAVAQGGPTSGALPLNVSFDATASSDPDPGDTLAYAWDLNGDGAYDDSTAAKPAHTYSTAGPVTVGLRVIDSHGASDTDSLRIYPGNRSPEAIIDQPSSTLTWKVGDSISFSGEGADDDEGTLPAADLSWSLVIRHCTTLTTCHTHPLQSWSGVESGSFVAPDHEYPSHLELTLTVTDSSGATDSRTVSLEPRTVDLNFESNPSGLQLAVGSSQQQTPFTRTVIVGSANSITAPASQSLGSEPYQFASWSDGGASAHDIVAPAGAATYTATYGRAPPSVFAVSPLENGTGVQRNAPVVAFFDRKMDKPSAEAAFSLKRSSGGAAISGTFGWYGNALIFVPSSPLASNASYTATVSTAAKDYIGTSLSAPKSWQFTTATQPVITAVVPADSATEVLPNGLVVVVFDTAMDKAAAQSAFSLKRSSDGAAVPGSFGWYGNALIFKPNTDLAGGAQYTASVTGAATDPAGHAIPTTKTWRFTTTERPIVDLVYPSSGSTGVSGGSVALVAFNKPMDKPSAEAAFSLVRSSDGAPVSGSIAWWGNLLIFTPASPLAPGTRYTATIAAGAKDPGGRTLANPTAWPFTTGGNAATQNVTVRPAPG